MSRTRRYLHLDVFTRRRCAGNQLAVVFDADDLGPAEMQQIAREFNFSETTFVLPADASDTDMRVRIFTPGQELPMAGHPTVGTAFALAHDGVLTPRQARVTFGLGVGPTPVSLEWKDDRLDFAWMTQRVPVFGPEVPEVEPLAAALGVELADIVDTGLPVVDASAGVPFLYVPLASRDAVDGASADTSGLIHFFQGAGLRDLPVFVFTLEEGVDDATVYSRMFAPIFGIAEDPATGSASGPLGAYLVRYGAVSPEQAGRQLSLQGVAMGRPSRIHIAVDVEEGLVTGVRIGGQSVVFAAGDLEF